MRILEVAVEVVVRHFLLRIPRKIISSECWLTMHLPNSCRLLIIICFIIAVFQIPLLLQKKGSGSTEREGGAEDDGGSGRSRSSGSSESYEDKSGDLSERKFFSNWTGTRRWFGPEYWANPIQDWSLKDGKAISPAAYQRSLCLLPFEIGEKGSSFEMTTTVQIRVKAKNTELQKFGSGFRIGRKGQVNDFRSALIDAKEWIDAYLRADGSLVISYTISQEKFNMNDGNVTLNLTATTKYGTTNLILKGTQNDKVISVEETFSVDRITGTFCLLSNGGGHQGKVETSFSEFSVTGDHVIEYVNRNFGPILWSQYSLNKNNLRILAQLALFEESIPVQLRIGDGRGNFELKQEVNSDVLSRTAIFEIDNWDSDLDREYEVSVKIGDKIEMWHGNIRADPKASKTLKIAAFSCDHGYAFPLPDMVQQVKDQNPDMMYFAGDQIYEVYGGFGDSRTADTDLAMLDFQRKYYQFGWTWRDQ